MKKTIYIVVGLLIISLSINIYQFVQMNNQNREEKIKEVEIIYYINNTGAKISQKQLECLKGYHTPGSINSFTQEEVNFYGDEKNYLELQKID